MGILSLHAVTSIGTSESALKKQSQIRLMSLSDWLSASALLGSTSDCS